MSVAQTLLVLIIIYKLVQWFFTRRYNYWKKQNVPTAPDLVPGFGHMWPIIILKISPQEYFKNIYNSYNTSVVGFFYLQTPSVLVRDPELIKCILQTNFPSFHANDIKINEKTDPVVSKNPFFANDPHIWKMTRARTVGHLTGKKLRSLYNIAHVVSNEMVDYISRRTKSSQSFYECELKDFFTRYTGEMVAKAGFGMEGQSFYDNPDRVAFVHIAKTIFTPSILNHIQLSLLHYLPDIADCLRIRFLSQNADNYFRESIKTIMTKRKETNSKPDDFLQFCVDTCENDLDTIIADVIIFYVDVYETSSTVLSNLTYLLSQHKDIQDKLREHIISKLKEKNGHVDFDSLKEMYYLDQVISESLRIIPPLGVIRKCCTDDITLTGSDDIQCNLKPGMKVFIPVMAIHHDSKYWSNPDKFDPERFNVENEEGRHKYVFLPFGEGPRMCLGRRLGIMLIKLATVMLLTKYSIEHSPRTKLPLEMEPSPLTSFKGGLWTRFKKLSDTN